MAKLTKEQRQEKHFVKQNEKEFKWLQRKVVNRLKKAVMTKAIRLELIADLDHCNNIDLVHYLATDGVFTSDHEYIEVINKWLELETITFDYSFELVYEVGNMPNVTKLITLQHNKIDLEKEILG